MPAKAYNPTTQPVVIDDEGRILPGREHGDVDTTSPRVGDAVVAGQLILSHGPTHDRVLAEARERRAAALADVQDAVGDAFADDDQDPAPVPASAVAAGSTGAPAASSSSTSSTKSAGIPATIKEV